MERDTRFDEIPAKEPTLGPKDALPHQQRLVAFRTGFAFGVPENLARTMKKAAGAVSSDPLYWDVSGNRTNNDETTREQIVKGGSTIIIDRREFGT